MRHSAAHLMADAILRVFPKAQLTIGPVVEDGFYYDIYLPEGKITPDDFPKIEAEMQRLAKAAHPFERCVSDGNDEAFARYKAIDGGSNKFKRELIEGIQERGDEMSFYKHGEFIDLCRGPHVPNTSWLANVKLTKVAGAYWRADASREQLVRVYGTAFFSKQELKDYLNMLEEAKKRDHRVLGERLELFTFDEDAPGFPFYLPKGTVLFNLLVEYMRGLLRRRGYQEVKTPLVLSEQLWHRSGHYSNYLENMFFTKLKLRAEDDADKILDNVEEDRPMAVKPMNCPGHLVVYRSKLHSHKEFPLRIAEMGLVHRRELSGVRHGLFRVQAFTQDDAHHFCTPEQIGGEIKMLIDFFSEVYAAFDLNDVRIELSTRPAKSIGSDEMWEKAETALKAALDEKGVSYQLNPGDGAFYGPKIDFHIRDVLKRSWQCGTIQLDFSMPERFGLTYIGADGNKHTPVMIHRAAYGSLERFLGIIIENYAGSFPMWLAPVQVTVIPVSDKFSAYARQVSERLLDAGGLDVLSRRLLPICALVTPNLDEAAELTGITVDDEGAMHQAADRLLLMGVPAVLVTGGHLAGETVVDLLRTADGLERRFEAERIDTTCTHGTGCTLSAGIAACLAQGMTLESSVERAIAFVRRAMDGTPHLGRGRAAPLDHGHVFRTRPAGTQVH